MTYRLQSAVLLLALGSVLGAPAGLRAQAPGTEPPPPQGTAEPSTPSPNRGAEMQGRQLEMLTRELNLTPEQVAQVRSIQADSLAQMMALRNEGSGADRRARMLALREAEQTKIKATLTDQQKLKFDAMLERMKQRREQGDAPPPPPPPQ